MFMRHVVKSLWLCSYHVPEEDSQPLTHGFNASQIAEGWHTRAHSVQTHTHVRAHKSTHANTVAEPHYEKPTQLSKGWFTRWSSKVSPHFNTPFVSPPPPSLHLSRSIRPSLLMSLSLSFSVSQSVPSFSPSFCLSLSGAIASCTSVALLFNKQRADDINNVASDCLFRRESGIMTVSRGCWEKLFFLLLLLFWMGRMIYV